MALLSLGNGAVWLRVRQEPALFPRRFRDVEGVKGLSDARHDTAMRVIPPLLAALSALTLAWVLLAR